MKLLTIAVPTYNRADHLQLLLRSLREQVCDVADSVQVLVSDNASTDGTPQLLTQARADWPELVTRRNEHNLGADGNFCEILDRIDTRYFWILGDDDMPKSGVIAMIVMLLTQESPALVYLQSEWVTSIAGPRQGTPIDRLSVRPLSRLEFARQVHVWCTFISGMIVDHQQLMRGLHGHTVRRYTGTSLVQLGWVFPVLDSATKFMFVSDRCVLATKDNTGGYSLLKVFGVNFTRVVREAFKSQPRIARVMIARNITRYLPGIIWNSRSPVGQPFIDDNPWPLMRRELGMQPLYWALLLPLGRFPRILAQPLYQAWRVVNRCSRELDAWTQRLRPPRGLSR